MTDKTSSRMEWGEAVFRKTGLSQSESAKLVESVLEHMSDALLRGEQVKISSFGTFSVRDKNARMGRNPKTGEEVPINPRRVLTFRPSHLMKDQVSAGKLGKSIEVIEDDGRSEEDEIATQLAEAAQAVDLLNRRLEENIKELEARLARLDGGKHG